MKKAGKYGKYGEKQELLGIIRYFTLSNLIWTWCVCLKGISILAIFDRKKLWLTIKFRDKPFSEGLIYSNPSKDRTTSFGHHFRQTFWHLMWHSIWPTIWYFIRHSYGHIFRKFYLPFYITMCSLSDIYSDSFSTFYLTYVLACCVTYNIYMYILTSHQCLSDISSVIWHSVWHISFRHILTFYVAFSYFM